VLDVRPLHDGIRCHAGSPCGGRRRPVA
jgi:hypothetical protein